MRRDTGPTQHRPLMTALPYGAALTRADLDAMPEDDGHRYELLDGALLVSPAPEARHQVCVGALYRLLHQAKPAGVVVLVAPFDYVVSDVTVLQPDVLVMRREAVEPRGTSEPPLLVVEVLSPGTRKNDRGSKRLAYEEAGVPVYWIVDPVEPSLTALHRVHGLYVQAAQVVGDEVYEAQLPYACRVVPADLVADLA